MLLHQLLRRHLRLPILQLQRYQIVQLRVLEVFVVMMDQVIHVELGILLIEIPIVVQGVEHKYAV